MTKREFDSSWHDDYRDTSWCYVGNLDKELSEGDVVCVLSQYGEVEDLHLVRDEETGKSKGFAFVKYEDWRSTVLAVDNFNGAVLLGKRLRVDHARYQRPKLKKEEEEKLTLDDKTKLQQPGHAYRKGKVQIKGEYSLAHGVNVFSSRSSSPTRRKKKRK